MKTEKKDQKAKEEKFDLMNIEPKKIVKLSEHEKKQRQIVEENPFVKIKDKETYSLAKERRTNLVSARTGLQSELKTVKSNLNNLKKFATEKYDELIEISKPHEDKQQTEVKNFEEKEAERKAAEKKKEEERVEKIEKSIAEYKEKLEAIISEMTFETIEKSNSEYYKVVSEMTEKNENGDFEEFGELITDAILDSEEDLVEKVGDLEAKEEQRIETIQNKLRSLENIVYKFLQDKKEDSTIEVSKKLEEAFELDFDFAEYKHEFETIKDKSFEIAHESEVKEKTEKEAENIKLAENALIQKISNAKTEEDLNKALSKFESYEAEYSENDSLVEESRKRINSAKKDRLKNILELEELNQFRAEKLSNQRKEILLENRFKEEEEFFTDEMETQIPKDVLAEFSEEDFQTILEKSKNDYEEMILKNERWNVRLPKLKKLGFKETGDSLTHNELSKPTKNSFIVKANEEDFKTWFDSVKESISESIKQKELDEKRKKRLAPEKKYLTKKVKALNFKTESGKIKEPESLEIEKEISSKIEELKNELLTLIENK